MQILNMTQGSAEWLQARCGVLTSSEFQTLLMKGKGSAPSKTRQTLLMKKAAERITGTPTESYSNGYMERGHEQEPVARELYEESTGSKVQECGFILNEGFGSSTDGLVEDDGVVEIKSRMAHLQIELLMSGEVPKEHQAQLQGGMMVSGRNWADFIAYSPNMPLFIKRVARDEEYIASLKDALAKAEEEINEIVKQVMRRF
jgi:putative phage-type endonuclease